MSVRVLGIAALNKKLGRIEQEARRSSVDAVRKSAEVVAEEARSLAPVRTGDLRRSITHGPGETKDTARAGTNLWRAHFTEFGTSATGKRDFGTPAQPFLFPAFEAKRQQVVQSIIAARVRGAIRGALQ